jgi:regulator of PEP synthase PpsR (kinase-PPPase family)
MPQIIIYLDEIENKKIEEYCRKWNVSKVDVVKKMIREFEVNNGKS